MTQTLERPSILSEELRNNLDEDFQTEIYETVDTLKFWFDYYRDNPNSIPEDWKEDLKGLKGKEYATVLGELCIKGEGYFPNPQDDEDPEPEMVNRYNELRSSIHEYLLTSEKTDFTLDRRTKSLATPKKRKIAELTEKYAHLNPVAFTKDRIAARKEQNKNVFLTEMPELDEAFMANFYKQVEAVASEYAARLARESDRSLGQLFHELSDRKIRTQLQDMMGGLATDLMDQADKVGLSDAERDQLIESTLEEVTDDVIDKLAEAQMQAFNNASPVRKYIHEKWNKWGEQGRLGKVKKGMVMGASGAVIGAATVAAAPIAGITVGAGIVGAFVATGSRSVGRGLLSAHLTRKANVPKDVEKQQHEIALELIDGKERSSYDVLNVIDSKVDKYRQRNRRRVVGGVAIAMTVGLASATAAEFLQHVVFDAESASAHGGNDAHPNRHTGANGRADLGEAHKAHGGRADLGPAHNAPGSDQVYSGGRADLGPAVDAPRGDLGETVSTSHGHLGREGMFRGYHGDRHLTPKGEKALTKSLDNYRVKSGDTIWDLSEQSLEEQGIKNPSVYEIDAAKDVLLEKLQASGSADRFGMLKAGARLKL